MSVITSLCTAKDYGKFELIIHGSESEMLFYNVSKVFVDETSETAKYVFNLNL